MHSALLLLCSFLPGQANAYAPEVLLRKVVAPAREIRAPGLHQYLNPFSEIGAAYEKGDFDKEEHEFTLSLSPKGIGEAVEYKRLAEALARDAEISGKLYRSQDLQTAYEALISAALAKEQSSSVAELQDLLAKTQKLTAIEARHSTTEVKNVLKANSDLQKSTEEIIEIESQLAGIQKFLSGHGLKLQELETGDLVGPEEIEAALAKIPVSEVALTSKKILSEVEVARHDAAHSTAKRSKLLDEVKVGMTQEKKKDPAFKLEVSINLPFLAAQDLGDYKDSLKVAEAEVKGRQAMLEESLKSAGVAEVLKRKIALYKAMGGDRKWANSALLRQDPALALDLQRSSVALRLTKASLAAEIRSLYVSLLLETEALAQDPELNRLSRSGRKI